MRIVPVTGDLPALVTSPPPPVRHVVEPPPAPTTAPVQSTAAARPDAGATSGDRRQHRPPCFDPPLIAQRAALGLPTGFLIAQLALSEGIPHAAAAAAVDREMPSRAD